MRESSNLAAKLGMMKKYGEMDEDNEEIFAMMADVEAIEGIDPITIKEESVQTNWPKWEGTINKKLYALEDAHTWTVIKCPDNMNVVRCK